MAPNIRPQVFPNSYMALKQEPLAVATVFFYKKSVANQETSERWGHLVYDYFYRPGGGGMALLDPLLKVTSKWPFILLCSQ